MAKLERALRDGIADFRLENSVEPNAVLVGGRTLALITMHEGHPLSAGLFEKPPRLMGLQPVLAGNPDALNPMRVLSPETLCAAFEKKNVQIPTPTTATK